VNYLGETDYLLPGVAFILEVVVLAALIVGLVLFPLVASARRQQWVWVLFVIVLGPVGGGLWFLYGREDSRARATT
jgi:hypothetical protein